MNHLSVEIRRQIALSLLNSENLPENLAALTPAEALDILAQNLEITVNFGRAIHEAKKKELFNKLNLAQEYLAQRHAPSKLLIDLFNLTSKQITEIRKKYSVIVSRPKKIDDHLLIQIYEAWKESGGYSDMVDRWLFMASTFDSIPLNSIYAAIMEKKS